MPAIVVLCYFSMLFYGMIDNVRGPFYPDLINELHLSSTRASLFYAVTSLFMVIGSWRSHAWLKKCSSLTLMNGSSLAFALGFAGVALSRNFGFMLLSCTVMGLGMGALNLSQNLILVEAAPARLSRRLMSGLHGMYGLASLLAPLTASLVRWQGLTWRQGFLLISIFPAVLSGIGLKMRPVRKRSASGTSHLSGLEWRMVLLFSLMMAAYLWGEISASSRMVLWLRRDLHFAPNRADLLLSAFFLTFLAGRFFFSLVQMAGLSNWVILWASSGLSALIYYLALKHSPYWMVLCGLSLSPFFPVAMEQVSQLFKEKSAHALGVVLGLGSLSVVVMHVAIGSLSDAFGLNRALFVAPTALILIFLGLSFVVLRPKRA